MVQLRPLGPSIQEIEFLQSHFVRYTKSQKKEFARLQQLGLASADDIARLQALLVALALGSAMLGGSLWQRRLPLKEKSAFNPAWESAVCYE